MHSVSFTARKIAYALLLVAAFEVETCDISTPVDLAVANFHDFDAICDFLVNRTVGVECVATLVDITESNCVADGD